VKRLVCAVAVLMGCGAENQLGGSVGELFSLNVSKVEVLRNDEAVQMIYYSNHDTFLDVVVRITVSTRESDGGMMELKTPLVIPLEGEALPGHQRTAVAHVPGGEAVRNFPKVKKGDLKLDLIGGEGQPSKGNFSMLFDGVGGDLGQNRTLTGTFSVSTTKDAGYGELP
jgi:hypothetical protein